MAKLASGTRIYGNTTIDTTLTINGSIAANSNTFGTLMVVGGAAISGNVYSGNVYITGPSTGITFADGTRQTTAATGGGGGGGTTSGFLANTIIVANSTGYLANSTGYYITANATFVAGNVLINGNTTSANTTTGSLVVVGGVGISGALNATTKSFNIPHPTKQGKTLRYGSLEGPEFGVYVRGRNDSNVIELPDYWVKLVNENSITVELTPFGKYQNLYVEKIQNNKIYVKNSQILGGELDYFFTVYAERKDVAKLDVEVD